MKEFAGAVWRPALVAGVTMATLMAAAASNAAPRANAEAQQAMQTMARARNCLTCHATDRSLLAPSFREIARRYADQPDADTRLTASITNGSRGVWGSIPMPASPQLAPGEAEQLAQWILEMRR